MTNALFTFTTIIAGEVKDGTCLQAHQAACPRALQAARRYGVEKPFTNQQLRKLPSAHPMQWRCLCYKASVLMLVLNVLSTERAR